MINLEQVKLLETKVAKAIDYVERVNGENAILLQREAELQARLESYQKRIEELEVLIVRFKEDQGRIEDGILAALDRLNQFEIAIEKSLTEKHDTVKKTPAREKEPAADPAVSGGGIFFEIPEADSEDDIEDPLAEGELEEDAEKPAENGELDIF
jgi:predicted nuclease with TOPRIM domain